MKLEFIHRSPGLLIVNKPNDLAVHGGSNVTNHLLKELKKKYKVKYNLVHRIDQATSGLVMLTEKADLVQQLSDKLKSGFKNYLIMVKGRFSSKMFIVDAPLEISNTQQRDLDKSKFDRLDRFKFDRQRRNSNFKKNNNQAKISSRQTVNSITKFKVVKSFAKFSLLSGELITGKTHQIRKQLQTLGHPILGDDKYGDYQLNQSLNDRWKLVSKSKFPLFLHAYQLIIKNQKNQRDTFTAPLPEHFNWFLSIYSQSDLAKKL